MTGRLILRAMTVGSWCAAWLWPAVHPKPSLRELVENLRHPEAQDD